MYVRYIRMYVHVCTCMYAVPVGKWWDMAVVLYLKPVPGSLPRIYMHVLKPHPHTVAIVASSKPLCWYISESVA